MSVVWHGGEPTATPVGLFRDLLAPFEELRRAGLVRHEIPPNATLINRQWCEPFDNLRGVTLGEDQLPDLTRLTVAALDLTIRND